MKPEYQFKTNAQPIRKVSFHTLGCKLNQAETDAIAALFANRGYEIVPFRQPADLTYINTCTVTNEADAKSRQVIRQAIEASPGGRVVAAGCYAQISPDEVAALDGVDIVLGTHEKYGLFDLLDRLQAGKLEQPLIRVGDTGDLVTFDESPFISATSRTRAFLKVQEGCDYHCSYCIIPLARGRGRSRPLTDCLAEARRLVDTGYRELVLTGVNIGAWQDGKRLFHDLLAAVSDIPGLRRIRVSSIEPNLITTDMLALMGARDNLCPHLHIPLQHASDSVLKAMRRRYLFADYREVLARVVETLPEAALGADVMVGFPGETEEDFQTLAAALAELPTTYHHIFRYSERSGTVAARISGQVDPAVRKERSRILREISRRKTQAYARCFVGRVQEVCFEQRVPGGGWEGITANYLRVRVADGGMQQGAFRQVLLTGQQDLVLTGAIAA